MAQFFWKNTKSNLKPVVLIGVLLLGSNLTLFAFAEKTVPDDAPAACDYCAKEAPLEFEIPILPLP
jgi:hypothetical protein